MPSLFSSPPKPKDIPVTPPPPKVEDTSIQDARAAAAQRRQKGRGFASTILSDLLSTPETVGAATGSKTTFGA